MTVEIVFLLAGLGLRAQSTEAYLPKPLLQCAGHSLLELAILNLTPRTTPYRHSFACLQEHLEHFPLADVIQAHSPEARIYALKQKTSGALMTALAAVAELPQERPLIIANTDQLLDFSVDEFIRDAQQRSLAGSIVSMRAGGANWSFIKLDQSGRVIEVKEKEVISDLATVGIYYFSSVQLFRQIAQLVHDRELRVRGEFYLAPSYNVLIEQDMSVGHWYVGKHEETMFGLGTKEEIERYQDNEKFHSLLTKYGEKRKS